MLVATALGAALLLTGEAPQSEGSVADLLTTACVETGLDREAFEDAARREGWRSVRLRSVSAGSGWDIGYRAGPYSVVLSRVDTEGDAAEASLGSMCMVTTEQPQADWRAELERFAVDQNLAAERPLEVPGYEVMPTWSRLGDRTLTSAYQDRPRSLTVTLARQVVVAGR